MSEFESLVDEYYGALFRFALSLAKDRETAADLVQQTFCIWAQKGEQLRDRSKAKTWLFTTLHREFLSHARRSRKYSSSEVSENLAEESAESAEDPDRQIDGQRALELLGELDETFRAPITLFYLQQHSYKEIAEILDIPMGTVMSRISRAKEMLRKKMMRGPASAPKNILQLEPGKLRSYHG
jgi:RNA polymerase sigma-70 factor (ECF subfamily)